ncbi:lytic transglycosylase domain-containing protein [Tatumella sp. OPLPL6]|uniref:lytic transglycosylase domain-containing protein n=1 Tax=Tatumella sp. OPLPL6 TaxID=1928657 RepID=UPI000C1A87DE|nr:lytic transglycosylase domain-containing protein [Tatumella sp. OPLPL6]PIJ46081.1 hypothetical protein BOM24_01590 [Tatumella sp. OPLPL6]
MAAPWEKYQGAAQSDSSGPWINYQTQQSAPNQGADVVSSTEQKYGIPSGLLNAVISKESSGNSNAVSPKGALGLGQVMPATAKEMGYDVDQLKRDPNMQVDAAGQYLGQMLRRSGGDVTKALAAYNWGPGNVDKYQSGQKKSMPSETQNYINDPRFSQWTNQQQPQVGSDSELDQLSQQTNQPWRTAPPQPTIGDDFEQAGKGLLQTGVNIANIPNAIENTAAGAVKDLGNYIGGPVGQALVNDANRPGFTDTIKGGAAYLGNKIGIGDGAYQPGTGFQLPESLQPTDEYAKAGAEIGSYLVPGPGEVNAISRAAPLVERAGNALSHMLSENVVGTLANSQQNGQIDPNQLLANTALGVAGSAGGRAIPAAFNGARNAIQDARVAREAGSAAPDIQPQAQVQPQPTTDYSQPSVGGDSNFTPQQQRFNPREPVEPQQGAAQEAPVVPEQAAPTPGIVGQDTASNYVSAAQSGNQGRIQQVVDDIQPDQGVIDAMKRLDLDPDDMLEAYTSGNDAFKAVQIGLASQDESVLGAVRRDSINRISNRAAKIIDDAGAMPDRLAMHDKFISEFNTTRDALKAQENALYKPIQEAINPRLQINPTNTRSYLDQLADDYGGYEHLSTLEKSVYEKIAPKGEDAAPPTYARLNLARSIVGAELGKAGTVFGSSEERNLSTLYSKLSDDRDVVAKQAGLGEQVKAANAITAQRKMMEKRIYSLLGKDLSGDVTFKAHSALNGLSKGDSKPFTQLMRSVKDKATRTQLIATGMRDMLRKGSRSDLANNINGFVDYYGVLKRNGSIRLLHSQLPEATVNQLDDMYTIARNVKSANQYYLATGKLSTFLKKFEQPGGFLDKLATHGKMATIATILGHVPVAGPVLNTAIAAQIGAKAATRKTGAEAVQQLMTSPEWKHLASAARNKPSAAVQDKIVTNSEKRISRSPAWKEFYRTLPAVDKQTIARVGIIGWLSNQ